MRRTIKTLPPAEVLKVYKRVRGSDQAARMWGTWGDRTLDCMADGAVTLATVWQSAWSEGGGDEAGHISLEKCKQPVLKADRKVLYDDDSFAESAWLANMTVRGG